MDNTTNSILSFFLDKSRSFGVKTAFTVVFLGLLVGVDLGLNLSYNLDVNNKLFQLERIQTLKKNYQQDSLKLAKVKRLEDRVLNKRHYSSLFRHLSINTHTSYTKNTNAKKSKTETTSPNKPKPIIVSTFWMVVSSSYALILIWPILLFLPLFPDQNFEKGQYSGWIALNVVWVVMIALITLIAYQIPIIEDNPTYNYWLNFAIHSIFAVLVGVVFAKSK